MALLATELRRLRSRRLVRVGLLVALAFVVVLPVLVGLNTSEGNPLRTTDIWLSQSRASDLGANENNALATISVLAYFLVVVIGASAIGAEYRFGTITTVLTWEPRRVRLLAVRMSAIALVTFLVLMILQAVFAGMMALAAAIWGETAGADGAFWADVALVVVRASLVGVVLALLAACVATLGRNTSAAIGGLFGYLVAIEIVLRNVKPSWAGWFLISNLSPLYAWDSVRQAGVTVTAPAGTGRTVVFLAVALAATLLVFRRRDVT